jgi:hypothetical protein
MVVKCRVPSRGSASATSYSTLAIFENVPNRVGAIVEVEGWNGRW